MICSWYIQCGCGHASAHALTHTMRLRRGTKLRRSSSTVYSCTHTVVGEQQSMSRARVSAEVKT